MEAGARRARHKRTPHLRTPQEQRPPSSGGATCPARSAGLAWAALVGETLKKGFAINPPDGGGFLGGAGGGAGNIAGSAGAAVAQPLEVAAAAPAGQGQLAMAGADELPAHRLAGQVRFPIWSAARPVRCFARRPPLGTKGRQRLLIHPAGCFARRFAARQWVASGARSSCWLLCSALRRLAQGFASERLLDLFAALLGARSRLQGRQQPARSASLLLGASPPGTRVMRSCSSCRVSLL